WINGMVASLSRTRLLRLPDSLPGQGRLRQWPSRLYRGFGGLSPPRTDGDRRPTGLQKKQPAAPEMPSLAQRAAASVRPTGTRSGLRIGLYLSGVLGDRPGLEPEPPKSVCAEIRSAHRFHVSAWWRSDRRTSLVLGLGRGRCGGIGNYLSGFLGD